MPTYSVTNTSINGVDSGNVYQRKESRKDLLKAWWRGFLAKIFFRVIFEETTIFDDRNGEIVHITHFYFMPRAWVMKGLVILLTFFVVLLIGVLKYIEILVNDLDAETDGGYYLLTYNNEKPRSWDAYRRF